MGIKLRKINEENLNDLREEIKELGHFSLYQQLELDGTLDIGSISKVLSFKRRVSKPGSLNALEQIEDLKEVYLTEAE